MKALYFAYGLNLSEYNMVEEHPSARFYKFAVLKGFKLSFSKTESNIGVCTISKGGNKDYIEGVLYSLNHYELKDPVPSSACSILDITCDNGELVSAHVYHTKEVISKTPTLDYLESLKKKYQDYGFNLGVIEEALTTTQE